MKRKIILLAFLFSLIMQPSYATKLPDNVWKYVSSQLPNATQRFDSVISLPNNVLYIPLYPAQRNDVETLKVDYSYPASGTLSTLPEVVIFNNNFVLLKVFKNNKGVFSITTNENLPARVRAGIMPQDMLVPAGLQIPESLKLVMGNLVIPQIKDVTLEPVANSKPGTFVGSVSNAKLAFTPLNELKSKKFFVGSNNSNFIYVYDGPAKEPFYELKLSSLPSKILASNNSKFALVLYYANKTLDVVDLQAERIMDKITLTGMPKDAEIDIKTDLAYVTSVETGTIYVIDMKSGKLVKEIKLEQAPDKIAIAPNGDSLAFIDYKTNEIYNLTMSDYVSRYIAKTSNVSKLLTEDNKIFSLSRTENKLHVYDSATGALLDEQEVNKKPVDAIKYGNKVFILCAKDATIVVYDASMQKIAKVVELDKIGFYSKITKIPNQSNAVISGIGTNKLLVLNLDDYSLKNKQQFEVNVSNLIMIDK